MKFSLPTDAAERKKLPIYSGFIRYFPLAIAAVAAVSQRGNDQHNPGQPLHWAREKSTDQLDATARHLIDVALGDDVGDLSILELAQVAWRVMAELQLRLEKQGGLK